MIDVRKPGTDKVAADHVSVVDVLIDLRAYARLKGLCGLIGKLDGVIRIAAETSDLGIEAELWSFILYQPKCLTMLQMRPLRAEVARPTSTLPAT